MKLNIIILSTLILLIFNIPAYGFELSIYSMNSTPGNDYIELGIYDTSGGYAGYNVNDPRNFVRNLQDFMPGALVAGSFADDKEPIIHYIDGDKPDGTSGHYKLAIYGQRLAIFSVKVIMTDKGNETDDRFVQYISGLTDTARIHYVQMDYTPGKPVVLTKIATSNDLIADITTAQKLNLIGNAHFVSDTIEKINEIEKERTKPVEKDDKLTPAQKAKKEYTELLKEITEKYNKPESDEFVKQEAYTVLKEDLEYIINHIQ